MGELRLPGLATGIDTTALVQQLMIIESRRLATYQVSKTEYEQQKTVFSELRARVNALKTAVSALSDADDLEIFKTSTSDKDVLTVSASSEANPGSHSIEINQLATSETWIQDTSTFDYETDYVGGGTFIYSYNGKERVITAVADDTTLEDFVGLINNDADNPGVTASLLYHDGKYHLMLNGNETGTDHQISINASSTEVWEMKDTFTEDSENATLSTKITELDQFTENSGFVGDEQIEITGTDRYGDAIALDLDLTEYTTLGHLLDEIEDAFDGNVKATLENGKIVVTDKAAGTSSLSVILTYDQGTGDTELTLPDEAGDWNETAGGATSESLSSLLSTSFIQTQNAQDSKIKVDGYPTTTAVSEVQTMSCSGNPGGGHYHLTYDGQTTGEIAYDAPPTGTGSIQEALEALPNVDAGDITVAGGGKGLDSGDVTFTFSDTLGDVSMILVDDSALTGSGPPDVGVTETVKGVDTWMSRNGNSVTDALTGVTLNLHDVTETDEPIEITVSRNKQAISGKIGSMMKAYNELTSLLAETTEYNDETKKMGILSTNLGVSFVKANVRNPFFGIASGFDDETDSFLQASDIGLTVDHHGVMELDQSELDNALDENFMDVVYLLGAIGIGDSDSNTIGFYGCSEEHTTGGTYDVDITVSGGTVTRAMIKLSSESTWRNAIWSGNGSLITGDSTFDDSGDPLYPENSLQLTVDLSVDGDFTATVRVKQGIAGALEDVLEEVVEADGRLDTGVEFVEDRIKQVQSRIEDEEARLEDIEARLIAKFARLESTLTMLQRQMSAVSMLTQITFGSALG